MVGAPAATSAGPTAVAPPIAREVVIADDGVVIPMVLLAGVAASCAAAVVAVLAAVAPRTATEVAVGKAGVASRVVLPAVAVALDPAAADAGGGGNVTVGEATAAARDSRFSLSMALLCGHATSLEKIESLIDARQQHCRQGNSPDCL